MLVRGEKIMYYVAVDSDILRAFAFVATGDNIGQVDKGCSLIKYCQNNLKLLKKFASENKLTLVITETVYGECSAMPALKTFMDKDYFKIVPTIDRDLVHGIAEAYTNPVILDDGTTMKKPMETHYVAALGKTAPTNDCYIMAEASVLGIDLLTFNYRDYMMYDNKPSIRVAAIAKINRELGLLFDNVNGEKDVPRPLKIDQFVDNFRHTKFILATDVEERLKSFGLKNEQSGKKFE